MIDDDYSVGECKISENRKWNKFLLYRISVCVCVCVFHGNIVSFISFPPTWIEIKANTQNRLTDKLSEYKPFAHMKCIN